MTRENIKDEVFDSINEYTSWNGFKPLEDGYSLREDLGLDSIDEVELIHEIEIMYNIDIPGEVIEKFETIRDIIDYLDTSVFTNGG